ncbi:MAG: S49 family peptidase [Hadesarchaea archaeon]|nr:S49 family peptidase [Hadesarchaea archaeon]
MARKRKRTAGQRYLKWAIVVLLILAALFYAGDWYSKYTTRIGVISVSGSIEDFRYADQAYDALRDPSIKAVVVVVDSPGGTVQASFETEAALRELNMEKPVVVTMGGYAASGAYLVSTASDYIFARSATETAGLGVVAVWVSYENKWKGEGIEYYRWTSGEMKDLWAPYRSPTPEESAELQSLVDDLMNEVIARIRINRPQIVNIDELKDGSTIWGYEALPYKLVDEIGDYEDALRKAADLAGLKKGGYTVVGLTS